MMRRLMAALLALCLPFLAAAETQPIDIEAEVCPGAVLADGVLTLPEGLTRLGWDPDEDGDVVNVYVAGDCLLDEAGDSLVHAVRLPSTLTTLDWYSFTFLDLDEDLVIPEGVTRVRSTSFMEVRAPRLALPSTVTELEPGGLNGYVPFPFGEIAIAPENPAFCVVDGVIFTRDMTELVLYPNTLTAVHYDVPAGVQVIRDGAFYQNGHLQTVSLPIGLRRIERYAFCLCGRLTAVNVPLTVTELGFGAFMECVSLERVTLPPAMAYLLTYDPEEGMYPDAVFEGCTAMNGGFQGDNGDAIAQPTPSREESENDWDAEIEAYG